MQKNQKGFTIIELIVVIAIIALLSGIVATNVTRYITKAKESRAKEEFANFEKALNLFYAKYGDYPHVADVGITSNFCPATISCAHPTSKGPYLIDATNGPFLTDFLNINWSSANATYYASGAYYNLQLRDASLIPDGKIGCAGIYLLYNNGVNGLYKTILCQDCPAQCGLEQSF